jgi:LmbE family N-acetylglucosaminyl deacetylase
MDKGRGGRMRKVDRWWTRVLVMWLAMGASLSASAAGKKVLVVAPHEDDETIACAGVIRNAVENGDDVRILLVTTGGVGDAPRKRLTQTIAAMDLLGVSKDKIIYLGYEELFVLMCAYHASPDELCPGTQEEQTFAPMDLITDYHTIKYGQPADFSRRSILGDIEEILDGLRPDDIYMPAHMERHNDHAATALFVTEAIIHIKQRTRYSPDVHEYMMYRSGLPQATLNALESVSNQSADMDATPYAWNEREVVPVPRSMVASLDSGANLKHAAFWRYRDDAESYSRFIKSDEIFWRKTMASLSYEAHVVASSALPERPASNVIDGVAMGAPFTTYEQTASNHHDFGVHEWIANESSCGAYVQLFWDKPILTNQVVLYDRPSTENQIIGGELTFSDGAIIAVGELPNHGSPLVVNFPPRWVSWLRFTVGSFVGDAPGLAELEVYDTRQVVPEHLVQAAETTAPTRAEPACRNCVLRVDAVTATSITVTAVYPNSAGWGNRLIYADLTTGVLTDVGTPFEMHDGTYPITGLAPNNMVDIDLVYLDDTQPQSWIDNIVTAGTLAE